MIAPYLAIIIYTTETENKMLVSKMLTDIKPAYNDSWEDVFKYFREDEHEWRRITELMEEISLNGQLEPGRIDLHEPDEDDPDDNESYLFLGNGTHRFAATVELGLEEYPTVEGSNELGEKENIRSYTKVELCTPSGLDGDKIFDCFSSSLNFRVDENTWAECEGSGSVGYKTFVEYGLYFNYIPDESLDAFVEKIFERIKCCITKDEITSLATQQTRDYKIEEDSTL